MVKGFYIMFRLQWRQASDQHNFAFWRTRETWRASFYAAFKNDQSKIGSDTSAPAATLFESFDGNSKPVKGTRYKMSVVKKTLRLQVNLKVFAEFRLGLLTCVLRNDGIPMTL